MPTNTLPQSALLQQLGLGGWQVLKEQPSTEMVTVPAAAPGLQPTQALKYPAGSLEWVVSDGKGASRTMTVSQAQAPATTTGGTPAGGPGAQGATTPATSVPGAITYSVISPPADVKAPTTETNPIISGVVTPQQKQIVRSVNGVPTAEANPIWDGTTVKPTTFQQGNTTYAIGADGKATPLVTDTGAETRANAAQGNQDLNAQSSAANARTAAASQAATLWAAQAANDLAVRVSNGEDAASIRAEQTEKAAELHQAWVEADGDAKRVQAQLDARNTETHATARDTQAASDATATAAANAAREASTQRGQDVQAASSKYSSDTAAASAKATADVQARTARLNAGNTLLQNSLSSLAEINKALPPGSDLAGKALEGMMAYGQKFLDKFSQDNPDAAAAKQLAAASVPAVPGTPVIDPTAPAAPVGLPIKTADTPAWVNPTPPETAAASSLRNGNPTDLQVEQYADTNKMPWDDARTAMTAPAAAVSAANDATTAGLVAQNAAAHAATMNTPPVQLHPDGSPLVAGPNAVDALFPGAAARAQAA